MAEAQKVDAEIGEVDFAAKAKRLDTLIKEKPSESDAFILASVKILKILKAR